MNNKRQVKAKLGHTVHIRVCHVNDSVKERCPSYPFLFLVEVYINYCVVVTGVLEISSNGEHGTKGQNWGDGVPGVRSPPVRNILATFYHNAYHFTNSGEICLSSLPLMRCTLNRKLIAERSYIPSVGKTSCNKFSFPFLKVKVFYCPQYFSCRFQLRKLWRSHIQDHSARSDEFQLSFELFLIAPAGVGNDDVSIVCAHKYEMVRMT